jgi:hypothetical protein
VNRGKKILILLLVIWVAVLAYNRGIFKGTPVMPERAKPGTLAQVALEDIPELRLDLLDSPKTRYKGIKKNIFSPLKFPKPKPKPPPKPPELPPKPVVQPPPPPPSPLEVFTSKVKFIGFLEKEKDRTVFLNMGEDVFVVKSGDIIDGRFRVAEITDTILRLNDEVNGEVGTVELESE